MRVNVPFHGLPVNSMKGPVFAGGALILALKAVAHYTVKAVNHTLEETHDAKHPTAHHPG